MNGLREKRQNAAQERIANREDGMETINWESALERLDAKFMRLFQNERMFRSKPCDVFQMWGSHWVKI